MNSDIIFNLLIFMLNHNGIHALKAVKIHPFSLVTISTGSVNWLLCLYCVGKHFELSWYYSFFSIELNDCGGFFLVTKNRIMMINNILEFLRKEDRIFSFQKLTLFENHNLLMLPVAASLRRNSECATKSRIFPRIIEQCKTVCQ